MVQRPLNNVRTYPHVWIPMADGCQLAARIWLPNKTEPTPAILEYIPYRKNDATAARDAQIHLYFAVHGYASVRVDLRGSGDSEGLLLDEYSTQELDDAVEVLAWIAAQPWCDGSVGMIGKSWGGFSGLQVAARRPPQLKAVISVCSTDDRYETDVHYIGGCVLASDMLSWGSTMLAFNARPPDPAVVGERWREMWLERLAGTPRFVEEWLAHQRRDDYWKHGSVCEDFGAITCPLFMVGGWADGYSDGVLRVLNGYGGPRRGLIGPWSHNYPHDAAPGPEIGFLQECLRWWDQWLRRVETGIMAEPMLRAWIQDSVDPRTSHIVRPGRWVGEPAWPSSGITADRWYLSAEGLARAEGATVEREVASNEACGSDAGSWLGWGRSFDPPADQRFEDALALRFDSAPLDHGFDILGTPVVSLMLAADRPLGAVAVRLCDVDESDVSLLVSRGILNLTHRHGHGILTPVQPGESELLRVVLKGAGHRFGSGHRLRVAVSASYWPWVWPAPDPVTLTMRCGSTSWLELPVRRPQECDESLPALQVPDAASDSSVTPLESPPNRRHLQVDVGSGRRDLLTDFDFFGARRLADGLVYRESAQDRLTVIPRDPLSARAESRWAIEIGRADWTTRIETVSTMSATATDFIVTNAVEAFEGHRRVFCDSHARAVRRDGT